MKSTKYIEIHVITRLRLTQQVISPTMTKLGVFNFSAEPSYIDLSEHPECKRFGTSSHRVSNSIMVHSKYVRPSAVKSFKARADRSLTRANKLYSGAVLNACKSPVSTYHEGLQHMILVPENMYLKTISNLPDILYANIVGATGSFACKHFLPKGANMVSLKSYFEFKMAKELQEVRWRNKGKVG